MHVKHVNLKKKTSKKLKLHTKASAREFAIRGQLLGKKSRSLRLPSNAVKKCVFVVSR